MDRPSGESNYRPSEQLQRLLALAMDGELSDAEIQSLEELLRDSEQARSYAVEVLQFHSLLKWNSIDLFTEDLIGREPESTATGSRELRPSVTENLASDLVDAPGPRMDKGSRLLWTGLAVSVLFLCSYFVLRDLGDQKKEVKRNRGVADASQSDPGADLVPENEKRILGYVGVVKLEDSVRQPDGSPILQVGQLVPSGVLRLADGWMAIEMFDGVEMQLVAPCEVEFDADRHLVVCHSGEVGIDVIDPNSKLSVQTPVGELLHVGTRYELAVDAESGETRLQVVDGEVELVSEALAAAPGSARIFGDGASVAMRPSGEIAKLAKQPRLSGWEQARQNSSRPTPYISDLGFTTQLVMIPGERAISSAEIAEGHTTIYSLEEAVKYFEAGLAAGDAIHTSGVRKVDFQDGFETEQFAAMRAEYVNLYETDARVPGMPPNNRPNECFVLRVTADLIVEESWEYSFIVNADDGCRLRIDGKDVIVDDAIHPPQQSVGTIPLQAGVHKLELVSFDHYGFYRLELGVCSGKVRSSRLFSVLQTRHADTVGERAIQ